MTLWHSCYRAFLWCIAVNQVESIHLIPFSFSKTSDQEDDKQQDQEEVEEVKEEDDEKKEQLDEKKAYGALRKSKSLNDIAAINGVTVLPPRQMTSLGEEITLPELPKPSVVRNELPSIVSEAIYEADIQLIVRRNRWKNIRNWVKTNFMCSSTTN